MKGPAAVNEMVVAAVSKFLSARDCVEGTFGVRGAENIVAGVLRGDHHRKGTCADGSEYLVHGVGYTVVLLGGGQVHIDAGANGLDVITSFDIQFFLETAPPGVETDIVEIEEQCSLLVDRGFLGRVTSRRYSLPGVR
jgi:hypothetical protein